MKERRYPARLFFFGFLRGILSSFFWLSIPGGILLLVGIWVNWCLYAGLALLALATILSFVEQLMFRRILLKDSDNEQFRKFQEVFSKDGDVGENIREYFDNIIKEAPAVEESQTGDLVMDLFDAVCKKCAYGDDIEKLNEHERVFYVTQILEQEVNNGGFSQFFFNSSGNFSNEVVDAFTRIGALKTAEICMKALAVFNGNVPTDRDERDELLDRLDCDDVLSECDDAFYEYEDDLEALNHAYIMAHRDSFD